MPRPHPDEVQTLSRISQYYSSGAICNVVKRALTTRRVERLARKPFSTNELIGPLAKEVRATALARAPPPAYARARTICATSRRMRAVSATRRRMRAVSATRRHRMRVTTPYSLGAACAPMLTPRRALGGPGAGADASLRG